MFKRAKELSFQDCLNMDYHLSQIMIYRNDFYNGVKEVLINKKQNYEWDPKNTRNIDDKIKTCFDKISTDKLKLNI